MLKGYAGRILRINLREKEIQKQPLPPKMAEDFLSMAANYFSDARHFHEKGDYERALACVNYAHGWLDAGARIGLFDVEGDDQLFTLYE